MGTLVLIALAFIAWLIYKFFRSISELFHNEPAPAAPQPDWRAERRKQDEANHRSDEEKQERLFQASQSIASDILGRNSTLIDQFFQIAERKVAVLDEYGDENWSALDAEILRCIEKIASAERGHISYSDLKRKRDPIRPPPRLDIEAFSDPFEKELAYLRGYSQSGRGVVVEQSEQYSPEALYRELFYGLEQRFRTYHDQQSCREYTSQEIGQMTGVEFENYLMRILNQCGCVVSGTPKTGDKGADIVARLSSRTIVIQAKRSKAPVGNGAVQEVVAALAYYRGTEAWVISNSTFTGAARELAQSNRVRLVGGADLGLIRQFIGQPI